MQNECFSLSFKYCDVVFRDLQLLLVAAITLLYIPTLVGICLGFGRLLLVIIIGSIVVDICWLLSVVVGICQ